MYICIYVSMQYTLILLITLLLYYYYNLSTITTTEIESECSN